MPDLLPLLRAHHRAAEKARNAASALGEAVAAEASRTLGGAWHPNGEHGACYTLSMGGAIFWLSLDGEGVFTFSFGSGWWGTHNGEGADPRAAAESWLRANTHHRRPEVKHAREVLATWGICG